MSENSYVPDKLGLDDTLELLTSVGNHEAKALGLLYLNTEPYFMTYRRMGSGFQEFIGPNTSWQPNIQALFQYCKNSFEPQGQVVNGTVQSSNSPGTAPAYAISERGTEEGVPLAALMLDWGIKYPEFSLQQVFGPTRSVSETRAPQSRIEVLGELLTSKSGISFTEIADTEGSWRERQNILVQDRISNAVKNLGKIGLVGIEQVTVNNDRAYLIVDSETPPSSTERILSAQGLYVFIQQRAASARHLFTFEECVDYVVEWVQAQQPDTDPPTIRHDLSQRLQIGHKTIPGVERLGTFNKGKGTKVFLNEAYRSALEDLLDTLIAIQEKAEDTIQLGRQKAEEISASSNLKQIIIDKAAHFSPYTNSQPRSQTARELLGIILETDTKLEVQGVIEEYHQRYGRNLSKITTRQILNILAKEQKVIITKERAYSKHNIRRNFYSPHPDNQDE